MPYNQEQLKARMTGATPLARLCGNEDVMPNVMRELGADKIQPAPAPQQPQPTPENWLKPTTGM